MPRQTTPPAEYPQAVLRQIEALGQNIATARKRRGESQAQWAKKLGVSQPTMARIERGDPSVAMASYVMCLWLINQAEGLAELIAPVHDHGALEREVAEARARRRPSSQGSRPLRLRPSVEESRGAAGSPASAVRSPPGSNAAGIAALLHPARPHEK